MGSALRYVLGTRLELRPDSLGYCSVLFVRRRSCGSTRQTGSLLVVIVGVWEGGRGDGISKGATIATDMQVV